MRQSPVEGRSLLVWRSRRPAERLDGASGGVLVARVLAQILVSILWDIGRDSCFTPIPIETGFRAILVQVRRAIHRPTGLGDWLNPTGSACWRRAGLGGSAGLLVKTSPKVERIPEGLEGNL